MVTHWKKDKMCIVCGKTFQGTAKAITCGSTCRGRLKRIVDAGKKPEYWLITQSKGQKMPKFDKKAIQPTKPPPRDMPPLKEAVNDELGLPTKKLTGIEILNHNAKIEAEIAKLIKKECPAGYHPRNFKLEISSEIDKLKERLIS